MAAAFVLTLAAALGDRENAQVQFINNSSNRTAAARLIEAVAQGVVYANLVPYYKKTYWVVGSNATRAKFLDSVVDAVQKYPRVDICIFSHGSTGGFAGMDWVDDSDIRNLIDRTSHVHRIGLVYMTQCKAYSLADDWNTVGADCVVGCPDNTLQVQVALEVPAFTHEFGTKRSTVKQARDRSWSVSAWTDAYQTDGQSSYKLILGNGQYRQR